MGEDLINSGLRGDVLRTLENWAAPCAEQDSLRNAFVSFMLARDDSLSSSCHPGHFSTSCLILHVKSRSTCLLMHPIAHAWMQPGGHIEDDGSLAEAAQREVREETGLEVSIDPIPIQMSCHKYDCPHVGPTRHLDVRFVGLIEGAAPDNLPAVFGNARWWPYDSLPGHSDGLQHLLDLGLKRLAALQP